VSAAADARRCRPRPQGRQEGDLRPTDVVGAFFVCGVAFLLAATAAGVVQWLFPWQWGRWLALHLAFAGGISQLVLGASQFFAGAFLATDPPPRVLVRAQLAAWNAGAILLAVAVPERAGALIWLAVAFLLAGLLAWAAAIAAMRRRSLRHAPWATYWYVSGAAFLGLGVIAGSLLAHGTPWTHGDLLGAHMALNLAGWFGGAIVGTLHTFYPSLTATRLRYPRLQAATFVAWTGGAGALAIGYGLALDPIAVGGWAALAIAASLLLANLLSSVRAAPRPLSLPARIVGVAQLFLLAALTIATAVVLKDGPGQALSGTAREAFGTLIVTGWIGLTVLGSLLHLLAVVIRVRGGFRAQMPTARPRFDICLAALAFTGVAGLSLFHAVGLDLWSALAQGALLLAYGALAALVLARAARILLSARPSL
jgi:hypothetical protein